MLQDLVNEKIKLTKIDRRILEARCEGLSFCEMAQEEITWGIDQIMCRGAAIYGCKLPDTDFFGTFISEEVQKLIIEFGYGELTLEEVLLAMMLNAKAEMSSDVEIVPIYFSGECFNVCFLAQVLNNYLKIRHNFDRKIQNFLDGY